MVTINITADLGGRIAESLSALIDSDYILLDIPYYTNIGDTLIYRGTEDFLSSLSGECLYKTAIENYVKPSISKNVIILFQGGGNFGDIWRRHTEFVLRVLDEFPHNKTIILPQTIYYENVKVLAADARQMAAHPNLSICARDKVSYQLATSHFFKNNIYLLPDMAFCISRSFLDKYRRPTGQKTLFFKRKDQEFAEYNFQKYVKAKGRVDELEWPSMDRHLLISKILHYLKRLNSVGRKTVFEGLTRRLLDWYAQTIYIPQLLKIGIRFISKYQQVYSTRLHGAILSILLDKPLIFFDNSYGKNSNFYATWLADFDNVRFIPKDDKNTM